MKFERKDVHHGSVEFPNNCAIKFVRNKQGQVVMEDPSQTDDFIQDDIVAAVAIAEAGFKATEDSFTFV